jgi:hypothetical protein
VTPAVVALLRVPQPAPEHPAPDKVQLTPRFWESFCTAAVNVADRETCTEVMAGEIDTVIAGAAEMVIEAAEDFEVSAMEAAVNVTVGGLGTTEGAVYVAPVAPALLSVPQLAEEHPGPDSDQETPLLLVSFCILTVND